MLDTISALVLVLTFWGDICKLAMYLQVFMSGLRQCQNVETA